MKRFVVGIGVALLMAQSGWASAKCSKEGKRLWVDGAKSYNLGNYEEAVKQWEDAYLICTDPELLFNLAQAYRKLDNYERARDLFKSWLRENPKADPAERDEVTVWVAQLEERIEEGRSAAQPPAEATPPEGPVLTRPPAESSGPPAEPAPTAPIRVLVIEPHSEAPHRDAPQTWYSDNRGWILVGGGCLALAIGVGLLKASDSFAANARTEPYEDVAATKFDYAEAALTAATVSFAAGGALLVWAVLRFRGHHHRDGSMKPQAVAASGGVPLFTWSF